MVTSAELKLFVLYYPRYIYVLERRFLDHHHVHCVGIICMARSQCEFQEPPLQLQGDVDAKGVESRQ